MANDVREYQFVENLGKGGMGEVFKARNTLIPEDLVAIKIIRPDLADNPELRKRFLREASVLLRLEHPNIMKYRHVFEEDGKLYLVNEFLEGASLSAVLASRPEISVEDGMEWLQQMVSGVSYAHRKGVIHRDLKPENVLVLTDNSVRILDFGLAKQLGSASGGVTASTQILGTPPYLPPEVIVGDVGVKDVGPEADVYALGVMAYRLFTGKLPYGVDENESSFKQISKLIHLHLTVTDIEPMEKFRRDIPPAFAQAVMSALERDPARRPTDVNDLFVEVLMGSLASIRDYNKTAVDRSRRGSSLNPENGGARTPPPAVSGESVETNEFGNRTAPAPAKTILEYPNFVEVPPAAAKPIDVPQPRDDEKPKPAATVPPVENKAAQRIEPTKPASTLDFAPKKPPTDDSLTRIAPYNPNYVPEAPAEVHAEPTVVVTPQLTAKTPAIEESPAVDAGNGGPDEEPDEPVDYRSEAFTGAATPFVSYVFDDAKEVVSVAVAPESATKAPTPSVSKRASKTTLSRPAPGRRKAIVWLLDGILGAGIVAIVVAMAHFWDGCG